MESSVLEQRIGRVHRLGQRNPVQVINFIAQGTIEEGMLSVLTFKKALFAGVLDGGEREVFLGGGRLSRFMETVEKTTTAIESQPTLVGMAVVRPCRTSRPNHEPWRQPHRGQPARRAGGPPLSKQAWCSSSSWQRLPTPRRTVAPKGSASSTAIRKRAKTP